MDQVFTEEDIVNILKQMTQLTSQSAVARDMGVNPAYICDILHRYRKVGPTVLKFLGFKKIVSYQKI